MEAMDHKCPSCTAPLPFNPTLQKWRCEYCGKSYTLMELEEYEKKENSKSNINNENDYKTIDFDVYQCSNCGAEILTDENTTATFCVYCGNSAIIKSRLKGMLRPEKIIPFKKTKQDAINAFLKFKKGKLFTPNDFDKKENIEKITGVYIPFWLYDFYVDGSVNATAQKIRTWSSGDYIYKKIDTFSVSREGNMEYDKVPADSSTNFDDDIMDSIEPFDYSELLDFNESYLSGFLSEKYDVTKEDAIKRAIARVTNSTVDKLKSTIVGYNSVQILNQNVNHKCNDSNYVLLPVWMLNINYKGKIRKFAMNGQTGKMIGDIPIDNVKRIKWSIFVYIFSFIVLFIFNIILNGGI